MAIERKHMQDIGMCVSRFGAHRLTELCLVASFDRTIILQLKGNGIATSIYGWLYVRKVISLILDLADINFWLALANLTFSAYTDVARLLQDILGDLRL